MAKIIPVVFLLVLLFPFAGYSTDLTTVSSKLICQCGCTMILSVCQCQKAEEMRNQIKTMIDQGKDEEEILKFFVNLYGEKVLGAPIKKGFNLLAYILPFIGILLGAILIWWLVRKWTRITHAEDKGEEVEQEYQEKIRKELDKYEF